MLDTAGIAISTAAERPGTPALGFDGANFLVVVGGLAQRHRRDIYGARVTPQGAVLDSAGFVISQAADDQYYPAVGFDGANFLVVWEDYRSGSDSTSTERG